MDLKNIRFYLKKFNFVNSDSIIKEKIISVLKDEIDVNIKKENINIKKNTVFINTHPIVKNCIFFKKQLLLDKIRESLSENDKNVNDIQ